MSKSSKMYEKSPSIKKNEEGKPGISAPTQADAEDMGVAGNPLPGSEGEDNIAVQQVSETHKRHAVEMKDMHKRHVDEVGDMHKRHLKEIAKVFEKKE